MKYDADFTQSLIYGQGGEELLRRIARAYLAKGEEAVEVKTDWRVSETGNLFIEAESRGKPSGLTVSTAPCWALVLDGEFYKKEVIVLIRRERLEKLCAGAHFGKGGDSDTSLGYFLPVGKLLSRRDGRGTGAQLGMI